MRRKTVAWVASGFVASAFMYLAYDGRPAYDPLDTLPGLKVVGDVSQVTTDGKNGPYIFNHEVSVHQSVEDAQRVLANALLPHKGWSYKQYEKTKGSLAMYGAFIGNVDGQSYEITVTRSEGDDGNGAELYERRPATAHESKRATIKDFFNKILPHQVRS